MAEIEFSRTSPSATATASRPSSDLNLDVADGEFMVLVGPSGCGKTTALRMVAGLEDITDGRAARSAARSSTTSRRSDRDIAMVFQNYALYPHMTVAENIGFALKLAEDAQGRDRPQGQRGGRDARPRPSTSTASRRSCRAASASASRWAARSCASPRCS